MSEERTETGATFEACQARLREIVVELEDPELPLERSLELYEEGTHLARRCQDLLDTAERRIEVLRRITGDGCETEPLEGVDEP